MLHTLSFSHEKTRWDSKADGERVASIILAAKHIHTLDLSGNTLGVDASQPIAEALKKHPELKIAHWKDLFTTRLNTEIPVVLKSFTDAMIFAGTRLTTLDLSDNAIGPQAIHGLQEFLSSAACFSLKNLYLNNCGLGSAGITVAQCLIDCHQKAMKAGKFFELEVFVAGRNRLENPGAKALASAFSTLKSLIEIRMPQNGIKEAGIMELAASLEKNPNLKIIDFGDNTFNQNGANAMSKVVGKLDNLKTLNFSDCLCRAEGSLNIVYELVSADSSVQEILLSGNEIGPETVKNIGKLASQLTSLTKLDISANNLGSSFSQIKFNNRVIDFGNESDDQGTLSPPSEEANGISDDEDVYETPNQTLPLEDWENDDQFFASITNDDIDLMLAATFNDALTLKPVQESQLQTLSFSHEKTRWDSKADGGRVASIILAAKHIHTLDLSGNTLGVEASQPIAEALKKHPELKIAQWKDMFTTRLNTEIPVVLKSFTDAMIFAGTRLTTLDLSDNAIGPQAIHGLQEFLSNCFSLKNLYLNNCGLGSAGIIVAQCLIDCHQKAMKSGKLFELEVFVAGRNRLENPGAKALASAFSTLKSLIEIRMPQCGITEAGIVELAVAISKNPNLKIVDLGDNTFNNAGANAMSKVIGKLDNLKTLNFSDCLCRAEGSLNIVYELVSADSSVQEIMLSGNEIDPETVKNIGKLASQLTSIKKLDLSANNFGSSFSEIKKEFNNGFIDFGNESDDQGTLSGSDDDE